MGNPRCYRYILDVLDGKTPRPCEDLMAWAAWVETADLHVAEEYLPGGVRVSTVFLTVEHGYGRGPPLLFETMIFGGPHDGYQRRCSTWAEAEFEHVLAVSVARQVPLLPERSS